ncbi:hypothetical protein PTI98_011019 [Pleurotus ostreatus]|nr:hypothetical protein PTI98_011019 [Pleurotus ostreatus]
MDRIKSREAEALLSEGCIPYRRSWVSRALCLQLSSNACEKSGLNLVELKERASQHICKSLTADNIAYEVFSPFAASFDDIRRFEVDFFLKNWATIRDSKAMRDVWHQIRIGHHPGFEEVWPVIVQNLEFIPPSSS